MGFKKLTILSILLGLGILPSFAKIDTGISQTHFYDTEKTIMNEVAPDTTLKTEKYWSNNPFYFTKYRPLFMLSNKELIDLMPREKTSVVQRITAPSVYNVSFKTSSITKISLSPYKPVAKNEVAPRETTKTSLEDRKFIFEYERAKNPVVDSDEKIEAARFLRDSKKVAHHKWALDLLDDVTRKEPYNAYAFYMKGEIYAKARDSQNAIKNYVQALKLNPTSKQCYLGIAKVLEPTNKKLAQKYYDKAEMVKG
jgi:tetratricopeptide (TPR) repeat protein